MAYVTACLIPENGLTSSSHFNPFFPSFLLLCFLQVLSTDITCRGKRYIGSSFHFSAIQSKLLIRRIRRRNNIANHLPFFNIIFILCIPRNISSNSGRNLCVQQTIPLRNRTDICRQFNQPTPIQFQHQQSIATVMATSLSRQNKFCRSRWTVGMMRNRAVDRGGVSGGAIRIYIRVKLNRIGGVRGRTSQPATHMHKEPIVSSYLPFCNISGYQAIRLIIF